MKQPIKKTIAALGQASTEYIILLVILVATLVFGAPLIGKALNGQTAESAKEIALLNHSGFVPIPIPPYRPGYPPTTPRSAAPGHSTGTTGSVATRSSAKSVAAAASSASSSPFTTTPRGGKKKSKSAKSSSSSKIAYTNIKVKPPTTITFDSADPTLPPVSITFVWARLGHIAEGHLPNSENYVPTVPPKSTLQNPYAGPAGIWEPTPEELVAALLDWLSDGSAVICVNSTPPDYSIWVPGQQMRFYIQDLIPGQAQIATAFPQNGPPAGCYP